MDGVLVVTPVLQPPVAGRHRGALPGRRRGDRRPPGHALRHPVRTGRRIAASDHGAGSPARSTNVVALKDATGDPAERPDSSRTPPTGFEVYSGDDDDHVAAAGGRRGGVGQRGVALGRRRDAVEMVAASVNGDVGGPRGSTPGCSSRFDFEIERRRPNPLPAKAVLRALGLPGGQCRLPLAGRRRAERARRGDRPTRAATVDRGRAWARGGARPRHLPGRARGDRPELRACIELDGRIVVLDCGIMFPERRHAGHRPGAARLHVPARAGRRGRGGDPHPRPRGPHRRPGLPAPRPVGSRSTDRPSRSGSPATASRRPACRPAPSFVAVQRRRAAPDRALRRRVHPGHPLGARTAFATAFHTPQGVILHSGDFKIDLTPVDGRPHRPGPDRDSRDGTGRAPAAVGLDQRRGARLHRVRDPGAARRCAPLRGPCRAGGSS